MLCAVSCDGFYFLALHVNHRNANEDLHAWFCLGRILVQENISFALNYHLSVGGWVLMRRSRKPKGEGAPAGFFSQPDKKWLDLFLPFSYVRVKTLDVSFSMFMEALESDTSGLLFLV
ncbi:hypothetical protein OIU77_003448 [Salix suchowensis]|uniref:Uncharacterized protein n=1 Tax=Salix suchowensis TaxID=1278906 RepID=A0ABQ9AZT1_9ROSI|nr:hypothetical protein OIU77_003448 [Salix suchowensis]